jgi:hypothetical protein
MKKQGLQILVLLLVAVLLVALTLTVLSLLDPIFFWVLAGLSAIFAFKVLPRIGQQ